MSHVLDLPFTEEEREIIECALALYVHSVAARARAAQRMSDHSEARDLDLEYRRASNLLSKIQG